VSAAALETRGLCKNFGALTVADDISFRLEAGARHALIGPNGAGKTTFVNMLSGALPPSSGRIVLGGEDITAMGQAKRVKRGLGRTFQINALFRRLAVLDNVALAVAERRGVAQRMLRAASAHADVRAESMELLATLGLAGDASSASSRSRSRSASNLAFCSSTSRQRACPRSNRIASCRCWTICPSTSRS
jgi:branched-chain amino acid transport system ATP-binding protein